MLGIGERKKKIDVQEAFSVWRLLTNRSVYVEELQILKNFAHDAEFKMILGNIINDYRKEIKALEKLAENYNVKGSEPPPSSQNVPGNSEIVRDSVTAETAFVFLKADINKTIASFRDTYVNDNVRSQLINLISEGLERLDSFIKYMKLKNWMQFPPIYPTNKEVEPIGCNEVFLVWDHLVFRYENIRKTQMYAEMTSDLDFRALLLAGIKVLQQQTKTLEEKLDYFGITMPPAYSDIAPVFPQIEPVENKFMYNDLLRGMQDALVLHGMAIQDIIVNDDLRKFFKQLTLSEVQIIKNYLKYGKTKGWIDIIPSYGVQSN